MKSLERVAPPAAWADPPAAARFVEDVLAVADGEVRKLRHDPVELLTRAIQPLLWLLVFGQVIAATRAIPTGSVPYLDFLAPGVLVQSALFVAIFYGIAVIWERDLGIVHKMIVSPASRVALVTGKALSGGVRALVQAVIIYALSFAIGIHVRLEPGPVLAVALVTVMGSALFATFSLIIACIVRTRERFMGIGQVLTMPLFFASSAVYPVAIMPAWLKVVASVNPLTYQVDATRALMVEGDASAHGVALDVAVLAVALVALLWVASRLYPRLAR